MLGTIFVVTPILGWTWPTITPLITAAAATIGYTQLTDPKRGGRQEGVLAKATLKQRTAVVNLSEVLLEPIADEVGREQRLLFEQGEVQLTFRRDVRGKFSVEVNGPDSWTRPQLEARGREFAKVLIQQFAHNRVVQELERRGLIVTGEEIAENGDIIVRSRRWS
jgi:hypothetical protein